MAVVEKSQYFGPAWLVLPFNLGQRHSNSETNTVVFTSQYDQVNLSGNELEFVTCRMKR